MKPQQSIFVPSWFEITFPRIYVSYKTYWISSHTHCGAMHPRNDLIKMIPPIHPTEKHTPIWYDDQVSKMSTNIGTKKCDGGDSDTRVWHFSVRANCTMRPQLFLTLIGMRQGGFTPLYFWIGFCQINSYQKCPNIFRGENSDQLR